MIWGGIASSPWPCHRGIKWEVSSNKVYSALTGRSSTLPIEHDFSSFRGLQLQPRYICTLRHGEDWLRCIGVRRDDQWCANPSPSMCCSGLLCGLGEAAWLITHREPACWIINFPSPLPYFFSLQIFLMLFLLVLFFLPFAKPLHPSFPFLWPTFLPQELTTSTLHWRLATQPRASWLYAWGEFVSSHWEFCLKAGGGRERERRRGNININMREWMGHGELESCCVLKADLAFCYEWSKKYDEFPE